MESLSEGSDREMDIEDGEDEAFWTRNKNTGTTEWTKDDEKQNKKENLLPVQEYIERRPHIESPHIIAEEEKSYPFWKDDFEKNDKQKKTLLQ